MSIGLISGSASLTTPRLRVITGTDPAANTEITETVPADKAWHVKGVAFTLVTDATAGNRVVKLLWDDGTTVFGEVNAAITHAASVTAVYRYSEGLGSVTGAATAGGGLSVSASLPVNLILPAAFRIRTSTTTIQAGDNFGAPLLYVVEYNLA